MTWQPAKVFGLCKRSKDKPCFERPRYLLLALFAVNNPLLLHSLFLDLLFIQLLTNRYPIPLIVMICTVGSFFR
jgi:hypothetical protein